MYVFNFYHPYLLFSDSFLVPSNIVTEDGTSPLYAVPVVNDVASHVIVVYLNFVGDRVDLSVQREVPIAIVFNLRVDEILHVVGIFFDERRHIHVKSGRRFVEWYNVDDRHDGLNVLVDVVVNFVVGFVHVAVYDLGIHLIRIVIIDACGAQHHIVVEACCANHVCILPANTTIRLVETICTNVDPGRQLEIGSVEAVIAHFNVQGRKVNKNIWVYMDSILHCSYTFCCFSFFF
jgi:hypothetical protein